jgi:hypothetical protein
MSSWSANNDAGPYTVTVSTPAELDAVPDTVNEKKHWVRDNNSTGEVTGFVNPWESSHEYTFPEIFKAMVQ